MWTLIVTAIIYSSAIDIEPIPGFKSRESCYAAGEVWLRGIPNVHGLRASYDCVEIK